MYVTQITKNSEQLHKVSQSMFVKHIRKKWSNVAFVYDAVS